MTLYMRSAVLSNYRELAASLHLNAQELLRRAGLPTQSLDNADLRVSSEAVMRLLELTAEDSGEEAFGLRLAETRRLSIMGLVGMAAREEPTMRDALVTLVRHAWRHNESLTSQLEERDGMATVYQHLLPASAAGRQAVELTVGSTHRILRTLLGASWTARAVCFMHAPPTRLETHRRMFGGAVRFSQDFNGIVLRSADLDTPMAMADPVMRDYAHQMLGKSSESMPVGARYEVQQLILALLPTGRCNVNQVALHLGVDRRTVHRRLEHEGCSFSYLLQQTREELSRKYLSDGSRLLSDIAPLLGFSSLSALSRWRRAGSTALPRGADPDAPRPSE